MKRFFILSLLALAACAEINVSESGDNLPDPSLSTKVLQNSLEYSSGEFFVKFNSVPSEADLAMLKDQGAVSVTNLFHHTPGMEELEAQFGLDRWYLVEVPDNIVLEDLVRTAAGLSSVCNVEYSPIIERTEDFFSARPVENSLTPMTKAAGQTFDDPMLVKQWHYNNQGDASVSPNAVKGADVNVVPVWQQLCAGDPSIIVGVVDEGVCYSHPDLAANMWTNPGEIPGNGIDDDNNGYIDDYYGYNFVDKGPITWNKAGDTGHGTHTSGTIAAVNNNGTGVCGVAGGSGNNDGCRIMSCQIFSGNGSSMVATLNAVKYAADMGASVISNSWGYTSPMASDDAYIKNTGAEYEVLRYFEAKKGNNDVLDGNIVVFSAGNNGANFCYYPGALVDIISVSSFAADFLPAYYTNYGPGCNICAPGGEYYHNSERSGEAGAVLSTLPTEKEKSGYGYMQGTSMACPHVSGVVALALSYAHKTGKHFTVQEFKNMLLSSTKDIDQRISKVKEKTYAGGHSPLPMAPYYHKMGTGAVDAWALCMKMDGVPSATAKIGESQWIDLSSTFGSASVSLTYTDVQVSQTVIDALGLQKMTPASQAKYPAVPATDCYAYVQFGRLYIHPTKMGSGIVSISAIGGGDIIGGGSNPPGGPVLTNKLSIIARDADGGNGTGGWL